MIQIKRMLMLLFIATIFIYLFVFQLAAIWPFTIDDMYISLRYAKHLADGTGLLWNIGEPPVEGYSNFSFVILGRIALSLGFNPVLVLKSAGVIGLFFTCTALYSLTRFWFKASLSIIPCIWLLAYKGQIIWAASGLETTVYEALIAWSVVFIYKGLGYSQNLSSHNNRKYFIFAAFLQVLACLTRPEAPVLMLLFTGLIYVQRPARDISNIKSGAMIFILTFIILYAPYFMWHWYTYRHLFPNPVYCKAHPLTMDLTLATQYLSLVWPFFLISCTAILKSTDRRHYFLWLPSLVYELLLIGSSPVVAFDNRLFLSSFVLLLPLTLQGIFVLIQQIFKTPTFLVDKCVTLLASVFLFCFIPMMTLKDFRYFTKNPIAGENLRMRVLGWLEKNTISNSTVVLADSGLIPYQSSLRFIDSYCLNNAEMTSFQSPKMYERFCTQILLKHPNVIILTALIENGHITYTPADACLTKKLKIDANYKMQASLSTADKNSLYLYEVYKLQSNKL